jgi:phospholipid N-methyltransferase
MIEYVECFLFGMLAASILFAIACRKSWLYCCEHRDNFYKALKNVKDDKEIVFHGDDEGDQL